MGLSYLQSVLLWLFYAGKYQQLALLGEQRQKAVLSMSVPGMGCWDTAPATEQQQGKANFETSNAY